MSWEEVADEMDRVIRRTLIVGALTTIGVVVAAVDLFHRHHRKP